MLDLNHQKSETTKEVMPEITMPENYLFITGAYRSGTTLLHHLLDGHPDLLCFPVENCIIRDYHYFNLFPHPGERSLSALNEGLKTKNVNKILEIIFNNEKLSLPLNKDIVLSGSTGNQVVSTDFDQSGFCQSFTEVLSSIGNKKDGFTAIDIFTAYNTAYFLSAWNEDFGNKNYFVNKCPEKGHCIEYYLDNFPGSKIIHIIRDPRACMASHKGTLAKNDFLPYHLFFDLVSITNDATERCAGLAVNERVHCVKYEDLVTDTEKEMKALAGFLGIPFDDCLLSPTILGQPWRSNTGVASIRSRDTTVYTSHINKFMHKLNDLEIQCIESLCREAMVDSGYDVIYEKTNIDKLRFIYFMKALPCRVRLKLQRKEGS